MKILTYKQYLTESEKFRQAVISYIQNKDYEVAHKDLSYQILDAIDQKSKSDKELRIEAYKYFICQSDYKTIKLREICKMAGYDYWNVRNMNKLDVSNAIDTIDTAHLYFGGEKAMQSFTLQKLSEYKASDGGISFSGALTPFMGAAEFVKQQLPNLHMTQLYRVNFNDYETCTTWENSDLEPVYPDILAIELNYQYVAIIADFGSEIMPVYLNLNENSPIIAPVYERFDWIKKATTAQLEAICEAVAAKLEDSKHEFQKVRNQVR